MYETFFHQLNFDAPILTRQQNWENRPFPQMIVPCSSQVIFQHTEFKFLIVLMPVLQRSPGDHSIFRSRKLVGDTGIGKAIAISGSTDSNCLMICSCKQGVILIRVNTEGFCD